MLALACWIRTDYDFRLPVLLSQASCCVPSPSARHRLVIAAHFREGFRSHPAASRFPSHHCHVQAGNIQKMTEHLLSLLTMAQDHLVCCPRQLKCSAAVCRQALLTVSCPTLPHKQRSCPKRLLEKSTQLEHRPQTEPSILSHLWSQV